MYSSRSRGIVVGVLVGVGVEVEVEVWSRLIQSDKRPIRDRA